MPWAEHPTALLVTHNVRVYVTDNVHVYVQHAMDNGWLVDKEGRPNLVALLSTAHEASLGLAQLHRGGVIHGGLSPASCFLKAARNQRGFVVKVCRCSSTVWCLKFQHFDA